MKREIPHVDPWKTAGLYATDTHYFIHAEICFIGAADYPEGAIHVLESNAAAKEIGTALIDAWGKGKFVAPDDPLFEEVFANDAPDKFEETLSAFAAYSGHANGEALLRKKPEYISASLDATAVNIAPTRWVGRGAWDFMKDVDADAEAIGQGVIEAFGRCR